VGAVAYAIATASAQQPAAPPQPTFRTEANYVRVDVYPTRDGAPILDLTQDDFEIIENGAPQKVDQFEHIVIRPAGAQNTRIEPSTIAESRSMATSPRARVFVVFLDTGHVDVFGSHNIRRPLIEMLNRVIGADDLVAVMTPDMSAKDITFARRTETIEGALTRHWTWGDRDQLTPLDPVEKQYEYCFGVQNTSSLTRTLIARRREKQTIDALEDLVRLLRGVREERKAIITISDGWVLYGPDHTLMETGRQVPTGPSVIVDPRTGKLSTHDTSNPAMTASSECFRDRMYLAQIDNRQQFLTLLDEANAANASFYPVDPRGLPVFDSPIENPLPLDADAANLRQRETTLRTIAENTDGIAIVNSNDLDRGLRRIAADLSSYYLLGYYSSGKLDGKFHSITVRVKRPGVQVRARRGYLAATPGALTAAAAAAAASAPKAPDATAVALTTALGSLADVQRELPLRVHVAAGYAPGASESSPSFWVVAEFAGAPQDRDVDVTVVAPSGATVGSATAHGNGRTILVPLLSSSSDAPTGGEYTIRVRSSGTGTGTVRITVPAAPEPAAALFVRRGPTTGNKDVVTADLRFRRNERIRVDVPTADTVAAAARLLDRTGKPLAIPLIATLRNDPDGSRWHTAELALAPLAPGDYVIEIVATRGVSANRTLAAFRIVP
jgi:VWFA-related protein